MLRSDTCHCTKHFLMQPPLLAGCNIVGRKADSRSLEQREQDWCAAYNKPAVHGAW
jgi:hypothetical protein